jgi:hypothetical protein
MEKHTEYRKQLAHEIAQMSEEDLEVVNEINKESFRILPVKIKPLTGGCTPGSCPAHYICDSKSGLCILDT